MIKLGQKVKDKVSGFEGIAIGRTKFLTGCNRVGVQPKVNKDGILPEDKWFDEPQLETIEEETDIKVGYRTNGGPLPFTPKKRNNSTRR